MLKSLGKSLPAKSAAVDCRRNFATKHVAPTVNVVADKLVDSKLSVAFPSSRGQLAAVVGDGTNVKVKYGPGGRSSVSGHTATVFGCTGFLGRYLVNELAKSGTQVVIPYRAGPEDVRDLKVMGDLGQVVPLRFDSRDKESISECVRHSDVVYNLIGRDYETKNFSFYDAHVEAARNIAEVCNETPSVQRFIHVSAMDANSKSTSKFLQTKGAGEIAVQVANPNSIIVRPGRMYGYEDRLLNYIGFTLTHPLKKWFFGGFLPLLDGGKHKLRPVYVGDVARGLAGLVQGSNVKPLYEFYGPREMEYRELAEIALEFSQRDFFPLSVPASIYRSIVSWTQLSPLARVTVDDIDRWSIDETVTPEAGTLPDVGVSPKALEALAINFMRVYRSAEAADQPWESEKYKS